MLVVLERLQADVQGLGARAEGRQAELTQFIKDSCERSGPVQAKPYIAKGGRRQFKLHVVAVDGAEMLPALFGKPNAASSSPVGPSRAMPARNVSLLTLYVSNVSAQKGQVVARMCRRFRRAHHQPRRALAAKKTAPHRGGPRGPHSQVGNGRPGSGETLAPTGAHRQVSNDREGRG
jgi:hypothetical protein